MTEEAKNFIGKAICRILIALAIVFFIAGIIDTASEQNKETEIKMHKEVKRVTDVYYIQNFPEGYKQVHYTVVYGDTLCRIAERNKPTYMTVSEYVEYLMEANHLKDSRIYEGQTLTIWAEEE